MSTAPTLVDQTQLLRQRARAAVQGPEHFLSEEAAFELQERLSDINRPFNSVAIVASFPDFWRIAFPDAHVIADAEVLDLEPGAHDLVIHAMALHWANDPVGQVIQSARALRPDGLFLAVLFGGQTLHELRRAFAQAETNVRGGMSPRIAPMGEIRDLGALLQRAGLALPVADSVQKTVQYRDVVHLMRDLRAMGEGNALASRDKRPMSRDLIAELSRIYHDSFATHGGDIVATFEMIFLSGWVPDASQQKPLRPGSATTRLADFLNTTELGEDAKPVRGGEKTQK